jgi:dTMP kinase
MPDKTFLFRLDPETLELRNSLKDKDRVECEQAEFYDAVLRGYAELEKRYPDRIIGIDASLGIDEIHIKIRNRVDEILKESYDV